MLIKVVNPVDLLDMIVYSHCNPLQQINMAVGELCFRVVAFHPELCSVTVLPL
jgi:hypothetical protein